MVENWQCQYGPGSKLYITKIPPITERHLTLEFTSSRLVDRSLLLRFCCISPTYLNAASLLTLSRSNLSARNKQLLLLLSDRDRPRNIRWLWLTCSYAFCRIGFLDSIPSLLLLLLRQKGVIFFLWLYSFWLSGFLCVCEWLCQCFLVADMALRHCQFYMNSSFLD